MLFLIWADVKYNTQKNPPVVFATQKNPVVFHRPKKIPFGQNVRPKKILRAPPSVKYVSGAPGQEILGLYEKENLTVPNLVPRALQVGQSQGKAPWGWGCLFPSGPTSFLSS